MQAHHRDDTLASVLTSEGALQAASQKGRISRANVRLVAEFIAGSNLVEQLAEWQLADAAHRHPGGRPPAVSLRTLLILLFLLALEGSPLLVSRMADILEHRLRRKTRLQHELFAAGPTESYYRVWRAADRLRRLIDPKPGPRRKRQTPSEWEATLAARDPRDTAKKQARLDWFANQLLEASSRLLPPEHRNFSGNITADATPVAAFGRGRNKRSRRLSSEPDAAYYRRSGDHRDNDDDTRSSGKVLYGWEAELLVQTTNNPTKPANFPLLVLGIAFHKPGHAPAQEAVKAFQSIRDRGHPAGYAIGDRLYSPGSKPENYQLPVRALGYKLVHDFRKDQLGVSESYAGAIQDEGSWYCPAMPEPLVNATIDHRINNTIDEDTWQQRINRRRIYALRAKEKPDTDGHVPLMCPAAGASATVSCPLKKLIGCPSDKGPKALFPVTNPPKHPDRICTNKTSVSFPPNAGAKYAQTLPFGTPEWQTLYAAGRNTVEGFNAYAKDEARHALATPGRRRLRGYTAQHLLTAVIIAAANIRKIVSYLNKTTDDTEVNDTVRPPKRPKRRTVALATYKPDTEHGTTPPA